MLGDARAISVHGMGFSYTEAERGQIKVSAKTSRPATATGFLWTD